MALFAAAALMVCCFIQLATCRQFSPQRLSVGLTGLSIATRCPQVSIWTGKFFSAESIAHGSRLFARYWWYGNASDWTVKLS